LKALFGRAFPATQACVAMLVKKWAWSWWTGRTQDVNPPWSKQLERQLDGFARALGTPDSTTEALKEFLSLLDWPSFSYSRPDQTSCGRECLLQVWQLILAAVQRLKCDPSDDDASHPHTHLLQKALVALLKRHEFDPAFARESSKAAVLYRQLMMKTLVLTVNLLTICKTRPDRQLSGFCADVLGIAYFRVPLLSSLLSATLADHTGLHPCPRRLKPALASELEALLSHDHPSAGTSASHAEHNCVLNEWLDLRGNPVIVDALMCFELDQQLRSPVWLRRFSMVADNFFLFAASVFANARDACGLHKDKAKASAAGAPPGSIAGPYPLQLIPERRFLLAEFLSRLSALEPSSYWTVSQCSAGLILCNPFVVNPLLRVVLTRTSVFNVSAVLHSLRLIESWLKVLKAEFAAIGPHLDHQLLFQAVTMLLCADQPQVIIRGVSLMYEHLEFFDPARRTEVVLKWLGEGGALRALAVHWDPGVRSAAHSLIVFKLQDLGRQCSVYYPNAAHLDIMDKQIQAAINGMLDTFRAIVANPPPPSRRLNGQGYMAQSLAENAALVPAYHAWVAQRNKNKGGITELPPMAEVVTVPKISDM